MSFPVSNLPNHSTRFLSIGSVAWGLFLLGTIFSWAAPRVVEYKEIPGKFEQYQDKSGFLWQVNKEGALTSGETQYLPSGLKLFLDGKPFQPGNGTLTDDTKSQGVLDLNLSETRGPLQVERRFWFDLDRGAVRVLDTVRNQGKEPAKIVVELKSAFQFPWQNLIGTSGRILGGSATVSLAPRDLGITTKFSVADGRQDTIFLVRGGKSGTSPVISASSNSRELVFRYELNIPPGNSRSLVHWMARRNIGKLEEIKNLTPSFYERRMLINSRVPGDLVDTVHNFDSAAFPDQSGPPPTLPRLISLNEVVDRVGVHRKNEDVLWVSPNNQLAGKISPNATVQIGETILPIGKIAAIAGGAGMGRIPRVFMRDGRVFAGDLELQNFSLKVGKEWAVQKWDAPQLNLLLLALHKSDGVAPPSAKAFVELRSGEVLAISAVDPELSFISVWGRRVVSLDELIDLQYITSPRPEFRLTHSDGSSLGVLMVQTPFNLVDVSGKTRALEARSIHRIWKTGGQLSPVEPIADAWMDWGDIPGDLVPESGFLLQGNNILSGRFVAKEMIAILDSGSVLEVAPSEITALRKLDASPKSKLPQFEVELKSGDIVKGGIRQITVRIGSEEESWLVPVRHLIAFRLEGGER